MSYTLPFFLTLIACFGLQSLALRAVGGKTNKSESNFFSSIARIQTGIRDQPEIMLLGSSMTGRLPDRNQGFVGVANLGCDGSSAVDTLRAMDAGKLPIAPLLIVEGNTLYRAVRADPSEIATAMDSPWFNIGKHVPNLGATARPAAFVYSKLMDHQLGAGQQTATMDIAPSNALGIPTGPTPALSEAESLLIDELSAVMGRLKNRGSMFLITVIPPSGNPDSASIRLPLALALKAQVPYWNLHAALPQSTISYTDGIHMTPSSAVTIMSFLSKGPSR
jgi:hypothetical protein